MLRNLWQSVGLVNGSQGEVVDIIYDENVRSPSPPKAVLVQFDETYRGPSFDRKIPRLVPIPVSTFKFDKAGKSRTRIQFPLLLSWALTTHRAQGCTLEKMILKLGERETCGLTYTGLSRVRTADDYILKAVSRDRIRRIGNCSAMRARIDFDKFLDKLHTLTLRTATPWEGA